jgi:hypothetical protein
MFSFQIIPRSDSNTRSELMLYWSFVLLTSTSQKKSPNTFSISLTLIMLVHSSTLFCISSASSIPFCIPEIFYSDDSFIAGWEGSTFGGLAIFDTGFLSVLSCVPHEKFIIR